MDNTDTASQLDGLKLIKALLWPALLCVCLLFTWWGFVQQQLILFFNMAYLLLAIGLYFLEKWLPFEPEWQRPDGQNMPALLHTLTSKGTVQILFAVSALIGLSDLIKPLALIDNGVWPSHLWLPLQIIIGLIIAEFGLYWMHRLAHETEFLWRFHAIHHAVTKLWFFNTGRFHFVDSVVSIVAVVVIMAVLGAPMEVLQWISVITAFVGLLTHCNVDMRCGWLNRIFNTPELHRWHHSKQLHEGNRNYGENLMLWDHLFGTWYHANYRPPRDIGIKEQTPRSFLSQLIWPFISDAYRKKLLPEYEAIPFEKERN